MQEGPEVDPELVGRNAAPATTPLTLDDLLDYVDATELEGVPVEVAGIVLAAREMGAAFAATRGTGGRRR